MIQPNRDVIKSISFSESPCVEPQPALTEGAPGQTRKDEIDLTGIARSGFETALALGAGTGAWASAAETPAATERVALWSATPLRGRGALPELRLHYQVAAAADRILSGQQAD